MNAVVDHMDANLVCVGATHPVPAIWAGVRRPYIVINHNNPMHMIRHDHIGTQFNEREMFRNRTPTFVCDFAEVVQDHFFIHHLAKNAITMPCHDCDIKRASSRIIISFQADGTAMAFLKINFGSWHVCPRFWAKSPRPWELVPCHNLLADQKNTRGLFPTWLRFD